ncbi:MAG: site-2 protease family protein [Planctomycetia bacterium]|nr:site-2 protease family protein [Planctomycetia bacterium]
MESREPIELPVEHIPNTEAAPYVQSFAFQIGGSPADQPRQPRRPRVVLPLLLFVATCISTFVVGGDMFGATTSVRQLVDQEDGQRVFRQVLTTDWGAAQTWLNGLKYSAALMAILFAHEMGHYLQARRYGVPASWPWFIPMPSPPMGTMGAVIVQASGYANRKQLFDIGISGPLAGLVLAIPTCVLGLRNCEVKVPDPDQVTMTFGDPLILQWLADLVIGPRPPGAELWLNPFLHAGWVGIFVTALNLIPIGQLDGGHILYCLIGRKAHVVARSLLWLAIGYMFLTKNWSYGFMVFLLFMMGAKHPPSRDDSVSLGRFREALGWITLCFVFVGFTPVPVSLEERPPTVEKPVDQKPELEAIVP